MADDDSGKFDAVQFGRLIEGFDNLKKSVDNLNSNITTISNDVASLKDTRSKGWGILTGVTLAAGSAGSMAHTVIEKLMK